MRFVAQGLLFIFFCLGGVSLMAESAPDSCECPQLSCNSCQEQKGLNFYSEKCEGGKKVKSCARPQCVPLNPLPARCGSANKSPKRNIASEKKVETLKLKEQVRGEKVATAITVTGKSWVVGSGGEKLALLKGTRLHEKDAVLTEPNSRVKVKFDDGNEFNLAPDSEVVIERAKVLAAMEKRQTILKLIKGKVRSKVKSKYKGAQNYYRVKTKSAVAGVRGTDFVVSYSVGKKEITTVQTLKGSVELANSEKDQKRVVGAMDKASFVIAANTSEVFDNDEISDFVAKGYMTPVYKMTAEEIKDVDWSTRVIEGMTERAIAQAKDKDDRICHSPSASLNQCSWTCMNNPKGSHSCRTDLPDVSCVRKRCNANGKWAEEHRLPASLSESCEGHEVKVGPCDY